MSRVACVDCGTILEGTGSPCEVCGASTERAGWAPTRTASGLHPVAPAVFAVMAIAIGVTGTLLSSVTFGIPMGLMGGGIGVWLLERGRRLR